MDTEEEAIKANAELVVSQLRELSGFDFGYDTASVQWLDGYINRLHESAEIGPDMMPGLVNVFGSYLGECVIRNYGGVWVKEEGTWLVQFDPLNSVYPFSKVHKHLTDGPEDSVASFYTLIPVVFHKEGGG